MSPQEIRTAIYRMLEATEDNKVLEDIQEYVVQRRNGIIPELGCTLEEYKLELEEGDAAIQRGKYFTQKEVFDYIDEKIAASRNETKVE